MALSDVAFCRCGSWGQLRVGGTLLRIAVILVPFSEHRIWQQMLSFKPTTAGDIVSLRFPVKSLWLPRCRDSAGGVWEELYAFVMLLSLTADI